VQADVKLTHGADREVVLCHTKTSIAVPDAILLESAMPTNGVAVAVLQQFIAGTVGTPSSKRPACDCRLLKEAVIAGELGGARRAVFSSGARNDLTQDPLGGAAGQSQRRSRRGRGRSP
jgi:hypothetical protein